ncbi:hypothetical protein Asulf_00946 [Archaeoglobus sulfaticallidus PM70-1]|uniref:Peptidase C-terminal archaeal/bacterial domain-containing protein n=1 Tax=Archaeoglobus sulfaticallidus PM70-1 TaxID=387631 RepID=N0BL71_9EURY|nr:PPC domain-containing protein [Archaeoglobus sulfaticallidus]AGK60950.1 hypothetical protein Asulf_00946 [Archaeoglobus sulfaticallidus PM70-1]
MRFVLIFLALFALVATASASVWDNAEEVFPGTCYFGELTYTGEVHYYKVQLSAGNSITISLSGPADADFDLYIYDPSVNLIASSTSGDSEESCTFTASVSGYYLIEVTSCSGTGSYMLDVGLVSGGGSSNDGGGSTFDCSLIPDWLGPLRDICYWLSDGANSLTEVLNGFKQFIIEKIQALTDFLGWLASLPFQAVDWLFNKLTEITSAAVENIKNAVDAFIKSLTDLGTAIGNFFGGLFSAVGGFVSGLLESIQGAFGWIGEQLGIAGEGLTENAIVIIAIVLVAVGVLFFRPALWIGVLLLGVWGLQQLAGQGNLVQGLFGDYKNLVMVIMGIAGLTILFKR